MNYLCIVPIFNEELKLKKLMKKINQAKNTINNLDFLIINNGSTDNSEAIIKKSKLNFISLKKNYGVGYALILGLKKAINLKYTHVIHLAGNGKMNPLQIKNFIKKIKNEKYQFVSGSRFLRKKDRKNNPIQRIIMIWILSKFISLLYANKITDATCGFRMFEVKLFKKDIKFFDQKKFYTYKYEYYSIGKILLKKYIKFTEIPVTMNYTKKNYSKIRPILDWIPIFNGWLEARVDAYK